MKTAIFSIVCVPFLSCSGITEGDRRANWQNVEAGAFIEANAAQPEVAQAGKDVKENATVVAGAIGKPEEPKSYTVDESTKAREDSAKEHAEQGGLLSWIAKTVGGLLGPWGAAAGSALAALVGFYQKFQWKKRVAVIADAVEHGVASVKNKDFSNVFFDAMRLYHEGKGTYNEIAHVLRVLKEKKKVLEREGRGA